MIGVIAAFAENAIELKQVKEISELLDPIPALTPNLIELGQLDQPLLHSPHRRIPKRAPPPPTRSPPSPRIQTHRSRRRISRRTDRPRPSQRKRSSRTSRPRWRERHQKQWTSAQTRKISGGEAAADRLVRAEPPRHGATSFSAAKLRTQKIVAWKSAARAATAPSQLNEKSARVREALPEFRRPACHSRFSSSAPKSPSASVEKLESAGQLIIWEEPLIPDDDPWESDYVPPNNILNAEQQPRSPKSATGSTPANSKPRSSTA